MANTFGTDILFPSPDPEAAAAIYVELPGFTITARVPMLELAGPHINLYLEKGPPLGPVFEVTVADAGEATRCLAARGCVVVKDGPHVPRRYVQDPNGLIDNLNLGRRRSPEMKKR